ncbi:hypothetical protein F8M41_013231 [Gigaspora margarita]|uniref:Uncharacterized protein n=1 Tax=Gigaspora margarita TaxID=4874 RepID=A0A8H3WYK3_GIGMA|nr:hypothetical protein F8M41_013231 [Gigaspora margarita]
MSDFYQIFKLPIFGNFNDNLLSATRTRLNRLHFPLSQAQEATDINDNFTINSLKKLFQIRELILQIDFTTCQLPNQTGVSANSRLPITTVFENIINNLNEPLRHLKYISDENESTRYAVGSEFKPERDDGHLREPCAIILESIQSFRWIDLNVNNAQAIRDLGEEIRDLKRKLDENREERDNKRPNDNNNNNNTPTSTTTSNTPTTTIPSTTIPSTSTTSISCCCCQKNVF